MQLTRSERRDLYVTAHEVKTITEAGKSQGDCAERVQSSSKNGGGIWYDWAIDMLHLTQGDRKIIDRAYLCSVMDERGHRDRETTKALRAYWKRVREAKGLIVQGLKIIEKLEAA